MKKCRGGSAVKVSKKVSPPFILFAGNVPTWIFSSFILSKIYFVVFVGFEKVPKMCQGHPHKHRRRRYWQHQDRQEPSLGERPFLSVLGRAAARSLTSVGDAAFLAWAGGRCEWLKECNAVDTALDNDIAVGPGLHASSNPESWIRHRDDTF